MEKRFQVRQGDVLVIAAAAPITDGEREVHTDSIILAHGEVTGHKHQLFVGKDAGEVIANRTQRQLTLMRTTALVHEEHGPVEIPNGTFDLPRQVEHTDEDEPRIVAD